MHEIDVLGAVPFHIGLYPAAPERLAAACSLEEIGAGFGPFQQQPEVISGV